MLGLTYGGLSLISILVAVYGYHLIARASAVLLQLGILSAVLMVIAFAGKMHLDYAGSHLVLGEFRRTWILSALTVGVGGVMFASTLLGDYTRYIPSTKYPTGKLLPMTLAAVAIAYIVPPIVAVLTATAFANPSATFTANLVNKSPNWFLVAVVYMATFGGLGASTEAVYSSGLNLHSMTTKLNRTRATWTVGWLSFAMVLLGSLAWDAQDSLSAATVILLALISPWVAIVGIGFINTHGNYDKDELQTFRLSLKNGTYWYSNGWNPIAVVAWVGGSAFGLLTANTTLYKGPWSNMANGIDVSFLGSFLIGGSTFLLISAVAHRRAAAAAVIGG